LLGLEVGYIPALKNVDIHVQPIRKVLL